MNTLFIVALIGEAIFSTSLIVAPGTMLGRFGVSFNEATITCARLFGSALLSFPVLLWFAGKSDNLEFKKGTVKSLFTYYLVSTLPLLTARFSGLANPLSWVVIGMHLTLLLWFGYFLVQRTG